MKRNSMLTIFVILVLALSAVPLGTQAAYADKSYTSFYIYSLADNCPKSGTPATCNSYFKYNYELIDSLKTEVENNFHMFTDNDKNNFLGIISTLNHFSDLKMLKNGTVDRYGEALKLAFDKADKDPDFRTKIFSQYLGVYEDIFLYHWSQVNLAKSSGLLYTQSVKDLVTEVLNDKIDGKNKYDIPYIPLITATNYIGYSGDSAMLDLGKKYEAKISKCIDSDGGDNEFVKGSLSGSDLWGNPIIQNDQCGMSGSRSFLTEKVCAGSSSEWKEHTCENGCVDGACVKPAGLVESPTPTPIPSPSPEPEISPTPKPKPATGVSIERALDMDNLKGKLTSNEISGIAQKVSEDYQTLTKEDKEFILNLPEEIKKKGLEKEEGADDTIVNMISNVFSKESDEDSWIKSARAMGKLSGQASFNFLNFLLETKISGTYYYSDRFYSEVIEAAKDSGDPRLLRQIENIKLVQEVGGQDILVESVNLCSGSPGSGTSPNECEGYYDEIDFAGGSYYIAEGKVRNLGSPRNVLITTSIVDPTTGTPIVRRTSQEIFLDGSATLALTQQISSYYLIGDKDFSVKIEIRDFDTGYKNVVTGKFGPGKKELTTPIAKRYGILLSNSKGNTIKSNIITPVIGVHASLRLLSSIGNNLISNKISAVGSGHGILMEGGSNKNRLSSNTILTQGKGSYGIYLKNSDDVTMMNDVILSANSKDVVAKKADLKLVNVSFNKEKTSFEDEARIEVVGVLDVLIKDAQTKQPVDGVEIEIKDNKGNKVVDESLTSGQKRGLELLSSKLNAVRDSSVSPLSADTTKTIAKSVGRPIPPLTPLGGDSWSFLPEYQPGESVYEGVDELPIVAPDPMPPSGGIIARADSAITDSDMLNKRLSFQENSPPVFTSTPPTKAYNGATYKYLVTTTDPDNDKPYFILLDNPPGMIIENHNNGSALVTWNPTPDQVGKTFPVIVAMDDQQGAENSVVIQSFNITVGGNGAPDIKTDAPTSGIVGAEYRYDIIASDPDNDPLKISLADKPTGMTIVDNKDGTATIKWTPQQTGKYNVKISVDDGKGFENSAVLESFAINVEAPGSVASASENPVGVRVEEDKVSYTLTVKALGYKTSSAQLDLTTSGVIDVFLVKLESPEQPPVPVVVEQASVSSVSGAAQSGSGSGSAGGSGSSSISIRATSVSKSKASGGIKVDRQKIELFVKEGKEINVNEIIPVSNGDKNKVDLNVQIVGGVKLDVDPAKISLGVGEEKIIKLKGKLSGLSPGTYTGKVIISSQDQTIKQEVNILLIVSPSEQNQLFDLEVNLDKKEAETLFTGDEIPIITKIVNVAGKEFETKVVYKIKDFDGNVLLEETESVKGSEPIVTIIKRMKTAGIKPGNYVVEASLIDSKEGQIAIAATTSFLNSKVTAKVVGGQGLPLEIIVVIVIIIALLGVTIKFKMIKKRR
ncbi:MAG TPA: Ig-like domain-containing protein [archaeon]|nr:Ig-like domain-containing protein [archaeon]